MQYFYMAHNQRNISTRATTINGRSTTDARFEHPIQKQPEQHNVEHTTPSNSRPSIGLHPSPKYRYRKAMLGMWTPQYISSNLQHQAKVKIKPQHHHQTNKTTTTKRIVTEGACDLVRQLVERKEKKNPWVVPSRALPLHSNCGSPQKRLASNLPGAVAAFSASLLMWSTNKRPVFSARSNSP